MTALQCDFYLGYMDIFWVDGQRFWVPHGEGIAVDATRRLVRCGALEDGNFRHVTCEFSF